MPLMVVSLLASCGNKLATATLVFDATSENCKLYYDSNAYNAGDTLTVEAEKDVSIIIESTDGYLPVFKDNLEVTGATSSTFIPYLQTVTINIAKDAKCTIKASTTKKAKDKLEDYTWKEINEISENGVAPLVFNIGDEKSVTVNEVPHQVRIIDFDHDELSTSTSDNPQYAGITFEFTNLISDKNGYSIAAPWNWEDGVESTNYDYLNSNLRKAIDGDGDTNICWYQKDETTQSSTYTKSIYEMITGDGLKEVIKSVKKPIALYDSTSGEYFVDNDKYITKLFPLSYREMTGELSEYAKNEGTTYSFYEFLWDTNDNRIKYQLKWHEDALTEPTIIEHMGDLDVNSYAGFNNNVENKCGGHLWLRSPCINSNSNMAGGVGSFGDFLIDCLVSHYLLGVAPAFCI